MSGTRQNPDVFQRPFFGRNANLPPKIWKEPDAPLFFHLRRNQLPTLTLGMKRAQALVAVK